nr:AAA domain-containing protein [Bacillus sp. THAF10]
MKKFGSTEYLLLNGRMVNSGPPYNYYFDTVFSISLPPNSLVTVEWGEIKTEARVLSSDGKNLILSFEKNLGDILTKAYLSHNPWELLDQLIQRLDEIKKEKKKRGRVRKLLQPDIEPKHPTSIIKSNVHELILRSKYNPVTFVWGPPGTGKTYTLARVAANKYFKAKKVLLLSHSNQSVNVLMKEITSFIVKKRKFKEGDILRFGTVTPEFELNFPPITSTTLIQAQDPELAKEKGAKTEERKQLKLELSESYSEKSSERLLKLEANLAKILEKVRQKELKLIKSAQIIGTTLSKAATDPSVYEADYDLVIIDEASMAYIPQIAFAASLAKHIIVCGDFKQLPPIASGRHELIDRWLKEDVFHLTGVADSINSGTLHAHLFLLNEQRRMHPEISAFTNRYIYSSLVGDYPGLKEVREKIAKQKPFPNTASLMLSTSGSGAYAFTERDSKSRVNIWHLVLSFQAMYEAYIDGVRSIGFITPYRAQASWMQELIEEMLPQEQGKDTIIAATVHRFQGSERDMVIFDSVDSHPFERPGMLLTGKNSERLINVAITRSRGKFIHVGDADFIQSKAYRDKTVRKLVDFQKNNQLSVLPHHIGKWVKQQHPNMQWMHAQKLDRLFYDVENATNSVCIYLPNNKELPVDWKQRLDNMRISVHLEKSKGVYPFPFVIIDQATLWLGVPFEAVHLAQPPHVCVRVQSRLLCRRLLESKE